MGPRGLIQPPPLPSRRGGVTGVDWLLGLPVTASGFDQVQVHVDHLSGKVHAEGTFPVAAVAGPDANTMTLPALFKCSPTVSVDRLKPYFLRTGRPPSPGPVTDPGQAGEYLVEQLLNRKTVQGQTYNPVRWSRVARPRLGGRLAGTGRARRELPGAGR